MPAGSFFIILFFVALFFAAWTSLISMIELATRVLQDGGMQRSRAIALVGIAGFALGIPSALNADVLANQDFVWGVGLMVSGLFFAMAVLRYGVTRFRETLINTEHADIRIGVWWDWAIRFVIIEAVVLIVWWFMNVRTEPLWGAFGVANMAVQFAVALLVFLLLNNWMADRTRAEVDRGAPPEGETVSSIP
jgi:NSS family neurotransmitter:Na+ symporter